MPAGINEATPAGATAFVKYYFRSIALSFYTRDARVIRSLSHPTCRTCERYIRSIASIKAANQHVSPGFGFQITFAAAPALVDGTASVDLIFNTPTVRLLSTSGVVVHTEKAARGAAETVLLRRRRQSWVVTEITG